MEPLLGRLRRHGLDLEYRRQQAPHYLVQTLLSYGLDFLDLDVCLFVGLVLGRLIAGCVLGFELLE
jgi:hypothetical protein